MNICKEVSGKEFKELYPNKKFYKVTNEQENHFCLQYKTGYNEDILEFNPTGQCSKGGLYFTEEEKIFLWIGSYEKYLRLVTILDDSRVYTFLENEY